jgi:hypothetical protein
MASATNGEAFDLEAFWEALLSSDPARIQPAWRSLSAEEAQAVRAHLKKMAEEPGWQPVQQQAAADALRVIADEPRVGADEPRPGADN